MLAPDSCGAQNKRQKIHPVAAYTVSHYSVSLFEFSFGFNKMRGIYGLSDYLLPYQTHWCMELFN
jgi:hypothetical protein